jgi:outer membrane protein assembly factor BamB
MSGMGGPGHTGGELGQVAGGMGLLRAWAAIWVNPADKVAWAFVGGGGGLASFTVDLNAGMPTLTPHWALRNGWTTAPFIANGVLYATNNAGEHTNGGGAHLVEALDPGTGNMLWSAMVGPHHWSSPIMVNGILYVADGDSGGCDVANGSPTCMPAGTNGKLTAWSIK